MIFWSRSHDRQDHFSPRVIGAATDRSGEVARAGVAFEEGLSPDAQAFLHFEAEDLRAWLEGHPESSLADAAYTLSGVTYDFFLNRFGRDGIQHYIEGTEGRLLRSLKSVLGSPLIDDVTLIHSV